MLHERRRTNRLLALIAFLLVAMTAGVVALLYGAL
jgi:hypothetical protein